MLAIIRQWRRQRILQRSGVDHDRWANVLARLPLLDGLNAAESDRLRQLTVVFLHERQIVPAAGLELTPDMTLHLAAQACLPIMNLDLDWYRNCSTVVLYPEGFVARHRYRDEFGLEHDETGAMSGEAWDTGPVVLSWADVAISGQRDGFNVVIHEFAHKLDMLNGDANGHPPLHADMSLPAWTGAFTRAYDDFCKRVDCGEATPGVDAYAAENPGEFFSVLSEVFFELPHELQAMYPEVYRQFAAFFRQSPAERLRPRQDRWPAGVEEGGRKL